MKRLLQSVACILAIPIPVVPIGAQNQTSNLLERWACVTSIACQQTSDTHPEVQEFARTAQIGTYSKDGKGSIVATFTARSIRSDRTVTQLKGDVEITTGALVVRADEADYHWDTGEIEGRGNVRIKPVGFFRNTRDQFGVK